MNDPAPLPGAALRQQLVTDLTKVKNQLVTVLATAAEVFDETERHLDVIDGTEAARYATACEEHGRAEVRKEYEHRVAVLELEIRHLKELHARELDAESGEVARLHREVAELKKKMDEKDLFLRELLQAQLCPQELVPPAALEPRSPKGGPAPVPLSDPSVRTYQPPMPMVTR